MRARRRSPSITPRPPSSPGAAAGALRRRVCRTPSDGESSAHARAQVLLLSSLRSSQCQGYFLDSMAAVTAAACRQAWACMPDGNLPDPLPRAAAAEGGIGEATLSRVGCVLASWTGARSSLGAPFFDQSQATHRPTALAPARAGRGGVQSALRVTVTAGCIGSCQRDLGPGQRAKRCARRTNVGRCHLPPARSRAAHAHRHEPRNVGPPTPVLYRGTEIRRGTEVTHWRSYRGTLGGGLRAPSARIGRAHIIRILTSQRTAGRT